MTNSGFTDEPSAGAAAETLSDSDREIIRAVRAYTGAKLACWPNGPCDNRKVSELSQAEFDLLILYCDASDHLESILRNQEQPAGLEAAAALLALLEDSINLDRGYPADNVEMLAIQRVSERGKWGLFRLAKSRKKSLWEERYPTAKTEDEAFWQMIFDRETDPKRITGWAEIRHFAEAHASVRGTPSEIQQYCRGLATLIADLPRGENTGSGSDDLVRIVNEMMDQQSMYSWN